MWRGSIVLQYRAGNKAYAGLWRQHLSLSSVRGLGHRKQVTFDYYVLSSFDWKEHVICHTAIL